MGEVMARSNDNHQLSFFTDILLASMVISTDRKKRQNSKPLQMFTVSPLKVKE